MNNPCSMESRLLARMRILIPRGWQWLPVALAGVLPPAATAAGDFQEVALPFLEVHCHDCHGGRKTKADLDLKQIRDDQRILPELKLWRNVLQQVTSGEMPPSTVAVRPTAGEIADFNRAVLDAIAAAESKLPPDPGRVTARRLNRTEYNNTVRDLLDVDFDAAENFPADDIGHGFDNIGDVLTMSPVHLERYLDAADGLVERAILLQLPKPPSGPRFPSSLNREGTVRRTARAR